MGIAFDMFMHKCNLSYSLLRVLCQKEVIVNLVETGSKLERFIRTNWRTALNN